MAELGTDSFTLKFMLFEFLARLARHTRQASSWTLTSDRKSSIFWLFQSSDSSNTAMSSYFLSSTGQIMIAVCCLQLLFTSFSESRYKAWLFMKVWETNACA